MAIKKDSPFFDFMQYSKQKVVESGLWAAYMRKLDIQKRVFSQSCQNTEKGFSG